MRASHLRLALLLATALVAAACHGPVRQPQGPDVAAPEDGPTLRPSPTPPGRNGDVSGPPVVKP